MVEESAVLLGQASISQDSLAQTFGQGVAAQLKGKRIIGCTTTGAAKYADAIRAISPGVLLLVEEAGEILIVTALGTSITEMILIDDHK